LRTNRPDGLTVIIIFFFTTAALSLLGGLYGFVFGQRDAGFLGQVCGVVQWLSPPIALAMLASSGLVYTLLAIATGVGLLVYHPWGRWGAIALAVLTLFSFPIGTVIGVAIIVYLMHPKIRASFK